MLTVSDGVANGTRVDESGETLARRLRDSGFQVTRGVVRDERGAVDAAVREAVGAHVLVVSTGGTGLAPRDVTPQALRDVLDYEVPGFGELMRAEGRRSTAYASLSRSLAGVAGRTLVLAVPGSPRAALESLEAVLPILDHALATLSGESAPHPPAEAASEPGSGATPLPHDA